MAELEIVRSQHKNDERQRRIDLDALCKAFQPFHRLHRPDEFEGHGVGLATVQRVVHRHGGRVRAEGAVEQGAKVSFTLPFSPAG